MAKQDFPALLPIGFHPMTKSEMKLRLVDAFPGSKRRPMIMGGFERLVQQLIDGQVTGQFWIDGSFLTKKIEPDDADVLLLVDGKLYDTASKAPTSQQVLIDWVGRRKSDIREKYLCHSFVHWVYDPGHPEHVDSQWKHAFWLRQFGFGHNAGAKGIATFQFP